MDYLVVVTIQFQLLRQTAETTARLPAHIGAQQAASKLLKPDVLGIASSQHSETCYLLGTWQRLPRPRHRASSRALMLRRL